MTATIKLQKLQNDLQENYKEILHCTQLFNAYPKTSKDIANKELSQEEHCGLQKRLVVATAGIINYLLAEVLASPGVKDTLDAKAKGYHAVTLRYLADSVREIRRIPLLLEDKKQTVEYLMGVIPVIITKSKNDLKTFFERLDFKGEVSVTN